MARPALPALVQEEDDLVLGRVLNTGSVESLRYPHARGPVDLVLGNPARSMPT